LGGPTKGTSLGAPELAVLAICGLDLLVEPWALGTMHAPSQVGALMLAAAGMVAALWPQPGPIAEARAWEHLFRFPIFWGGLALLAYVIIQATNPAWRFVTDAHSWWLVPLIPRPHLPSGVEAPFDRSNPWRSAVIWATPWLLSCALWCGLRRRLSYRLLFGAVTGAGALLAVVGLIQRLSAADRILWAYRPANDAQFMATFIYRNHAGAYFDLVLAAALGLATWHGRRWRRRQEGPGATIGFSFAAALIATGVVFTDSRLSIALMALPLIAISAGVATRNDPGHRPFQWVRWLVAALPILAIFAIALVSFASGDVRNRFSSLLAHPGETLGFREEARRAAEEMLADRWMFGWGAGCFRYGFPLYAQRYPVIYFSANHQLRYWEHAHDDLVEFPLELGVVGMIPIVVGLAFVVWRLGTVQAWRNPFSLCATAGCLATLGHAWMDFVFQNPAVLALWVALLVGAIRWAELDKNIERRRSSGGAPHSDGTSPKQSGPVTADN